MRGANKVCDGWLKVDTPHNLHNGEEQEHDNDESAHCTPPQRIQPIRESKQLRPQARLFAQIVIVDAVVVLFDPCTTLLPYTVTDVVSDSVSSKDNRTRTKVDAISQIVAYLVP